MINYLCQSQILRVKIKNSDNFTLIHKNNNNNLPPFNPQGAESPIMWDYVICEVEVEQRRGGTSPWREGRTIKKRRRRRRRRKNTRRRVSEGGNTRRSLHRNKWLQTPRSPRCPPASLRHAPRVLKASRLLLLLLGRGRSTLHLVVIWVLFPTGWAESRRRRRSRRWILIQVFGIAPHSFPERSTVEPDPVRSDSTDPWISHAGFLLHREMNNAQWELHELNR